VGGSLDKARKMDLYSVQVGREIAQALGSTTRQTTRLRDQGRGMEPFSRVQHVFLWMVPTVVTGQAPATTPRKRVALNCIRAPTWVELALLLHLKEVQLNGKQSARPLALVLVPISKTLHQSLTFASCGQSSNSSGALGSDSKGMLTSLPFPVI